MKRMLSLMMLLTLVLSMTVTAWATEVGLEGNPEQNEQEQVNENPESDNSDQPAETHEIITSWYDLISAVNDAADGEVIYIGTNIEITTSATIGSEDKHITLCLDSSYEDNLSGVFWTSSRYDNSEETYNSELSFVNVTFDGGNFRCCPLFSFNRDVNIVGCEFINWNGYYGGGFISFGGNSLGNTVSTVDNCIFDRINTNIAVLNVGWSAEVEINNCQFKNIAGINGSAIFNMGTAIVGANYYQNCTATNVNAFIYNQNTLHLTTEMEAYESLYGVTPFGWYCNYLFDEKGMVYQPDMMQPYNSDDGILLCGLTLMMENPYPQPEETPDSEDTENVDQPQTPDEPENPTETPSAPSEQPDSGEGDNTLPDTEEPPTTPDLPLDEPDNDDDDEPTVIYRPVYIYVPVEPESEEPEPVEPDLICGDAIIDVYRSVVLEGYNDGFLHLEDGLTRAQFMTILYRLLDAESIEKYDSADSIFADVASDSWYCRYISTIANAGIVCGTGNGNFDPDASLTWGHIITILSRFVEQQECNLQNIQYDGWAADAVETAVALGWITDHAAFDADAAITRGELAYFVNYVLSLYR